MGLNAIIISNERYTQRRINQKQRTMKANLQSLITVLRAILGIGLLIYAFMFLYLLTPLTMSHTSLNEFIFILYCPLVMIFAIILSFKSYKWAGILLITHAILYLISSSIENGPILVIGLPALFLGSALLWHSRVNI